LLFCPSGAQNDVDWIRAQLILQGLQNNAVMQFRID
jgi:hypothetical protein